MKVKFLSLASGSSGNCYYLGTDTYGILIDAGIGVRTIKKCLKEYGLALEKVRAVFVTHDHADHIKAVGTLGEKYGIPVYSTPEIHAGINKNYCMTEKLTSASVRHIQKEVPVSLEDFTVIADAYILIEYRGREYEYLLEMENNKSFNYKKYYKLEQEGILVPPLVVCTDRKVYNYCKYLEIIKVKLNLSDIDKLVKDFTLMVREYNYRKI